MSLLDENLELFFLVLVALTGSVTDLKYGKVYNWLTFPAFFMALGLAFMKPGTQPFVDALLAGGLALLLYGWMFVTGWMGAGDVKFLMTLCAIGGSARFAFHTAVVGIFLGGVVALLILFRQGRLLDFWRRLFHSLQTVTMRELKAQAPRLDAQSRFPMALPLALSAIWVRIQDPVIAWRLLPW